MNKAKAIELMKEVKELTKYRDAFKNILNKLKQL